MNRRLAALVPVALFFALALASCSAGIAPFSQPALDQATSLKADALSLMDHATEPFDGHRQEVEGLTARVDQACADAKGRPRNSQATRQWEILRDPAGHLLGGFMGRWQRDSTLSAVFVTEAKGNVAMAFDTIIRLESGKAPPADKK